MEATETQVNKKPQAKKVDFSKHIEQVKDNYQPIADIQQRLKGAKKELRKDLEGQHRFAMNKIRKEIAVLKLEIRKAKDVKAEQALLTWERQRLLINTADEDVLNKMEQETLKDECECYNKPPAGFHATLGEKYKYYSYFDEARQKDIYVTYIDREITPEEQITKELDRKMKNGFMPEEKDYLPSKTRMYRRVLVDSQWKRIFREV